MLTQHMGLERTVRLPGKHHLFVIFFSINFDQELYNSIYNQVHVYYILKLDFGMMTNA